MDGKKEIPVKQILIGEYEQEDIYEGKDIMQNEESEKSLGDIVTNDRKKEKNIRARVNKGRGIANDLLETLVKMLAGAEHHKTGVTLRNPILISSMLTNSESWYNITNANIVALQQVDEKLLRGILKSHRMTTRALLYLELGCLPLRYILK